MTRPTRPQRSSLALAALAALALLALSPHAAAAQEESPPAEPGAAPAAAPAPAPRPTPCATPEYRQFDFWIGTWEVRSPAGQLAGHNTIRPILGGCVLHESWTGNGGSVGESFNIYDGVGGEWHQTWVDNGGLLLQIHGGLDEDGRMVLHGEAPRPDGRGVNLNEITWTPEADGAVRQHWRVSSDGGYTWQDAFVGIYRKTDTEPAEAASAPETSE